MEMPVIVRVLTQIGDDDLLIERESFRFETWDEYCAWKEATALAQAEEKAREEAHQQGLDFVRDNPW